MAEAALVEIPRLMAALRDAVAQGDHAKLRLTAHTLKGSVRYFGARQVCHRASELEELGKRNELAGAASALAALETDVQQLTAVLADYLRGIY
jgi:HPt (histidine-containing phosphotransfer) domain-containing protein